MTAPLPGTAPPPGAAPATALDTVRAPDTAGEPGRAGGGAGVPAGWTVGPTVEVPALSLAELIVAQARRRPGAVAVRQWDDTLTYGQLLAGAAAVATRLRELGVGREVPVVVCTRRRPHLLIAVLGVLLAGGAYVPLDPDHPARRRDLLLADAGAGAAVVDAAGARVLAGWALPTVPVPSTVDAEPPSTMDIATPGPDDAAYVLFTSGSTGRPKGVLVPHRAAVDHIWSVGAAMRIGERSCSLGFAAVGYDVSVADLFVPLVRGGSIALAGAADRVDPARLQRFLAEHRVTFAYLPPPLLPLLHPDQLPDLTDVIVGGEASGPEQVQRWSNPPHRRFHNWYGPTETTVSSTGSELTGRWDRPLPIGRPLANERVYILDAGLRPVPPGIPGELCVGGTQVARGYLGRPGLTAQRFVPDPYAATPGARLYRTGDLAVWQPDGRIGFLGRLDRQVKVSGQRVEVGEVEAVLRGHPEVLQAAVDAVPGAAGDTELVGYLAGPRPPRLAEVRRHCADRLPPHMIPTRVVPLSELPLTASGKVDLAALRAPTAAARP
ncbi:MAG TPA: amino acid adenylation domain-containing protein, partial [Mycobacteriales bacterium]|nr:amino acid adenylation domain-containing protein [Mycobacteriales bacterium]